MSYVFFVQGTGALLGNVFGFLLERRFDRRLLLGIYLLTGSVVNIFIPLVPNFAYLLCLFLLQGITKGLADFGENRFSSVQFGWVPFSSVRLGSAWRDLVQFGSGWFCSTRLDVVQFGSVRFDSVQFKSAPFR